ncbi:MAG: polysaccharide deacetylase family protein [Gemmatimonadales bacterium]
MGLVALAAGAAVGSCAALVAPPNWLLDTIATLHPGCLYRVEVEEPIVALTIDDGPDPVTTPRILAQLAHHRSQATFFLISDRVTGREPVVRSLAGAGHELGNHLTRDEPSIGLSRGRFEEALLQAHEVLSAFGPIRWVRPGSGWYSQAMIGTMERHGYRCALGSVYPFDAAVPSARWAAGYVLRNVRPGAVIILHEGAGRGGRTIEVLRVVLPELKRRGYRVVTLSELVRTGATGG